MARSVWTVTVTNNTSHALLYKGNSGSGWSEQGIEVLKHQVFGLETTFTIRRATADAASDSSVRSQWGWLYFDLVPNTFKSASMTAYPVAVKIFLDASGSRTLKCAYAEPGLDWRPMNERDSFPYTQIGKVQWGRNFIQRVELALSDSDFPADLLPPQPQKLDRWMTSFAAQQPNARHWPLTRWCFPGNPNPCSCGTDAGDFAPECQDHELRSQMRNGQRYFDVRFRLPKLNKAKFLRRLSQEVEEVVGEKWSPALELNDQICSLQQIKDFACQRPGEVFIINISTNQDGNHHASAQSSELSSEMMNIFSSKLVPEPAPGSRCPSYDEVVGSGRNIILIMDKALIKDMPISEYVWDLSPRGYYGVYSGLVDELQLEGCEDDEFDDLDALTSLHGITAEPRAKDIKGCSNWLAHWPLT